MGSPSTFQAGDVRTLTGLSANQIREWTSRRGILPADQPARGRGKHAHYTWNTVLVLRILFELHRSFGVEIAAWANVGTRLRDHLAGTSPIGLHGKYLQIRADTFEIVVSTASRFSEATILIPLDPHLEVLAAGLGLPLPSQLTLFPAVRA